MSGENLSNQISLLPDYLGHHLLLTVTALGIGIAVCLPLSIAVTRVKPLQWPTLAFASVMQTIPGIALLALMVPLLGQIGFVPALVALVLYSMLPIIRNTVTGILGVDPRLTEAARGAGMTSAQMLRRVELPLAAPVIIAGIRTSAVWVVGTATLSTPVGATSLGNYIFSGLQTQNMTAVLVGCIAAAGLAIVLDQLIHLAEIAASRRSRALGMVAVLSLVVLVGAGLSPMLFNAAGERSRQEIVIGGKPFTEQYILTQLISDVLDSAGYKPSVRSGMGSTILFNALAQNNIDCYVDYSGTLWTNIMKRDTNPGRAAVLQDLKEWLMEKHKIRMLGALGFENTYALAIPRVLAERFSIRSITDLARYAPHLKIGSDYEFFGRPEWAALKQKYDLRFAQQLTFDPTLMYKAVHEGSVDVISAYSTDGRIIAYDLIVLNDPLQALPPYDAVLLLSPQAAQSKDLGRTLQPFIGAIPDSLMRQANKRVDLDGLSIDAAASELYKRLSP